MQYLVVKSLTVPIQLNSQYQNRWQVMGKNLYVDVQQTTRLDPPPANLPEAYGIKDPELFYDFLQDWQRNSLVLYRGISGCHFCWEGLQNGELRSEGNDDNPTFTMSDTGRGTTRWLPTTANKIVAEGISLQKCDIFTQELSLRGPVPIGFTVEIKAGSAKGLSLCWINSGEILVKGPLESPQYRLLSISWMDVKQVDFRAWPNAFPNVFLPPQRPYEPARADIDQWWTDPVCQVWMDEVARHDTVIQHRRGFVRRAPERRASV